MRVHQAHLILGEACRRWEEGNVQHLLALFLEDVAFVVHSRGWAQSMVREGVGRALLGERLQMLLDQVEVQSFVLTDVRMDGVRVGGWFNYCYRHRANGLQVEGTMRHKFGFVGDRIAHFELINDTHLLRAFYDMPGCARG